MSGDGLGQKEKFLQLRQLKLSRQLLLLNKSKNKFQNLKSHQSQKLSKQGLLLRKSKKNLKYGQLQRLFQKALNEYNPFLLKKKPPSRDEKSGRRFRAAPVGRFAQGSYFTTTFLPSTSVRLSGL